MHYLPYLRLVVFVLALALKAGGFQPLDFAWD